MSGAAAVGATVAVLISIFPWMNIVIRFLFMNVAASILMIFIAFGRLKKADFIKQIIALYLITYFVGGLMNSLYYYTNIRLHLIQFGNSLTLSNISLKYVLPVLIIMLPCSMLLLWFQRWYQGNDRETCEVELFLESRSLKTRGLLDTGNCLYDPIFRKPVMVIEHTLIENLLDSEFRKDFENAKKYMEGNDYNISEWDVHSEHLLRLRIIPYQSVGKAQGMMIGLLLDKVLIHTGKETICNKKVTAAISDNGLSTKDDYHVILHKGLL